MKAVNELESNHSINERLLVCAREARERYLEAVQTVDRSVPGATYKEIFVAILKMVAYHWNIRHQSTLVQFMERADDVESGIMMAKRRHEAMCDHALDITEMEIFRKQFEYIGFMHPLVCTLQITNSGVEGVIGWDLSTQILDCR